MAEILVIEDNMDLVETYTDLLGKHGHSVIRASRLSEAGELLAKLRPRVITLDLHLPGSSNAALASFMQLAKLLGSPKIIVISGHPEMMMGVEWIEYVDLVLTKPVDNHHLVTVIERLLR